MDILNSARDLSRTPPRSALLRLGGFAIIVRTIDKCRAEIMNRLGDYKFNDFIDQKLFNFKNILADDFKEFVATGVSDEDIVTWFKANGIVRSKEEIEEWSDQVSSLSLIDDPDQADWFKKECERLGLDPKRTTLFQMMDIDDDKKFLRVI